MSYVRNKTMCINITILFLKSVTFVTSTFSKTETFFISHVFAMDAIS